MSRSFLPCVVVLAGVLVAVPAPRSHGCAVVPGRDGRIDISAENALIVYDSATKTEHFIRTAAFTASTSADFGFLVPTPSKPELAESSPDVFGALAEITKPRTVVERKMREPNFGCWLLPEAKMQFTQVGSAIMPAAGVSVVERKRVGNLDAAVLQADDPKALRGWLSDNGFTTSPQLEKWFGTYTANKWFLTAFKIASEGSGTKTVNNTAVRISFRTDTPFYPYREPETAAPVTPGAGRSLRVFVLSDARVMGKIGTGDAATPFPGRTVWSNQVDAGRLATVTAAGKLPEPAGNRYLHLTEFEDHSSPRPGTDEVYFTPSADQSAVERPPHVRYEYYDPWPWVWLAVFVFGVAFVVIRIGQAVRKK